VADDEALDQEAILERYPPNALERHLTAGYDFLIAPNGMMNTTRRLEITRYPQTSRSSAAPFPSLSTWVMPHSTRTTCSLDLRTRTP
jgi:hypothetical protein